MAYSDFHIAALDFDWFIFGENINIHVASAGGRVPKIIQNNMKRNKANARDVAEMPFIFVDSEIVVNETIKEGISEHMPSNYVEKVCALMFPNAENRDFDFYFKNIYCKSFIDMAKKGFYSFDCVCLDGDFRFQLIAYPPSSQYKVAHRKDSYNVCTMTMKDLFENGEIHFEPIDLNGIVNQLFSKK